MTKFTNVTAIPLSLAVWLATDDYSHNANPKTISVTTLLQSTKEIILSQRVPPELGTVDLSNLIASRIGTAIHDSIEKAWRNNYMKALEGLGYPQAVIERFRVNPTDADLAAAKEQGLPIIPVYLETRREKKLNGWTITGEFDFAADGRVEDFKSTGTYTYIKKTNDEKYKLQGSMYRWINPHIIERDNMVIQFIFTDWQAMQANSPDYPSSKILEYPITLLSVPETEAWIARKLAELDQFLDAPEAAMPRCTAEELWAKPPVWKYYKNPAKMSRSTKNYDTRAEAHARCNQEGKGTVVEVPGIVTKCKYCNAYAICQQKEEYLLNGMLKP